MKWKIKIFSIVLFILLLFSGVPLRAEETRAELATFSNCTVTILKDREYFFALKDALKKAKKDITLSFYHFKLRGEEHYLPDSIFMELLAAARRGVKVSVLLEQGKPEEAAIRNRDNLTVKERLSAAGAKVFLDSPRRTTHTKLAVIDGRYTFVGSHNLTQSALKYNREVSVMIDSPAVAKEVLSYIASLLDEVR